MPRNQLKDLEKSLTAGSLIVTNADRIAKYLPPQAEGYQLRIVGGVPAWTSPAEASGYVVNGEFGDWDPGELNVVYLDSVNNTFYIWDGSEYVQIPDAGDYSFTLTGDSGPDQLISNAGTLEITASKGFTTETSNTGVVTIVPPTGLNNGDVLVWDNGAGAWVPDALDAGAATFTPSGNVSATDVQGAIEELDNEKQANIQWQDEGVNAGSPGEVETVNITGAGATATFLAGVLTINIPANSGETNTASNVNTSGVGVFKQKSGVNFEFRGINADDSTIGVNLDNVHNEIDLSVNISSTSGNIITKDGNGILARQVVEYFSPADGSNTLTLTLTPKSGTVIMVHRNGIIAIPTTDWSILGNVITMVDAFNPSTGGEAGVQKAHVIYWI
ncbi:MAG TPA: hypothetical protein PLP63_06900 [Saprospiraceae bacterium]|nr:hypothetical protein [Saprospiraceae bacterium]